MENNDEIAGQVGSEVDKKADLPAGLHVISVQVDPPRAAARGALAQTASLANWRVCVTLTSSLTIYITFIAFLFGCPLEGHCRTLI